MVKKSIPRVKEGHHLQWINAIRAGFDKAKTSSSFDISGPLTESVLMGNLAEAPSKRSNWKLGFLFCVACFRESQSFEIVSYVS